MDNLWLLGGEIIRDLNYNPSLRKKNVEEVLREVIDADGGPLIHDGTSETAELLRFDLPQTSPLPQPTAALNPKIAHKFLRRRIKQLEPIQVKTPAKAAGQDEKQYRQLPQRRDLPFRPFGGQ